MVSRVNVGRRNSFWERRPFGAKVKLVFSISIMRAEGPSCFSYSPLIEETFVFVGDGLIGIGGGRDLGGFRARSYVRRFFCVRGEKVGAPH